VRTEEYLLGRNIQNSAVRDEAGRIASSEANPRDSLQRGSGGYRKILVGDLVSKAMNKAARDIKEGGMLQ
jgi:CO/xanthine dehydrogenase FAD-binding subunit